MTVFLYEMKRKIELTLRETSNLPNWNLPMDNNDFRIFKDVQNVIEFIVRDTDRKPINMTDRAATITFYDQRAEKILFTSTMEVVLPLKGLCRLTIEPTVLDDWFFDTYSFCVYVTNSDNSTHMLYVDANESQRGFFQLCQGPGFDPRPSITVTYDELSVIQVGDIDQTLWTYRYTSALPGSMKINNTSGNHTAMIYFDNYSGELTIQGSTNESTPTDNDWFNITTNGEEIHTYHHFSGSQMFTFQSNLMWVRFWIKNDNDQFLDQISPLPEDIGSITKIVFRN